jgi:hypothetical protein
MLFNTPSDNTTALICGWNELCRNGIEKEHDEAVNRLASLQLLQPFLTRYRLTHSTTSVREHFDACQAEIDLTSVLYIVASAEARIRKDAIRRACCRTDALGKSLARLHDSREPDWRMPFREGILAAWKTYARTELSGPDIEPCVQAIGGFSTSLDIRHWIAHGRGWAASQHVTDDVVARAANAADKLITSLRKLAELGQIAPFV